MLSNNNTRAALVNSGNITPSNMPGAYKPKDLKEFQAQAIAARRAELNVKPTVQKKQAGFTLPELLFVIVGIIVICLLIGVVYIAWHFIGKRKELEYHVGCYAHPM